MRTLSLLVILTIISFSSFAQSQKATSAHLPTQSGNKLLGVNAILLTAPRDGEIAPSEPYALGLRARAGYFLSNDFIVGLDLTISDEYKGMADGKNWATKVGAFGRYYPGKALRKDGTINKLRPFVECGAAFGRVRYRDYDVFISNNIFDLRIMPGVNYFIKRWLAAELALAGTFEFPDYGKQGRFIYAPNLGLQFFLGGK